VAGKAARTGARADAEEQLRLRREDNYGRSNLAHPFLRAWAQRRGSASGGAGLGVAAADKRPEQEITVLSDDDDDDTVTVSMWPAAETEASNPSATEPRHGVIAALVAASTTAATTAAVALATDAATSIDVPVPVPVPVPSTVAAAAMAVEAGPRGAVLSVDAALAHAMALILSGPANLDDELDATPTVVYVWPPPTTCAMLTHRHHAHIDRHIHTSTPIHACTHMHTHVRLWRPAR
jgi:hypothetical protein